MLKSQTLEDFTNLHRSRGDNMARKIISKKTITFYEGDENLLQSILKAAESEKRNFSSYTLKALMDAVGETNLSNEDQAEVPQESFNALNNW